MQGHIVAAALFLVVSVANAATTYSSLGMQITFYVPHNAPECAKSIEGCVATSRSGLDGKSIPRSLDDVRAGRAKYVTLASCPNNYGKYFALGKITYRSAEDNQIYTVDDVVGYVHDTGGDFPNGINKRGVHGCRKLDVNTTICYKCTSDQQAGALASGKNVSFAPNGQGVGDPSLPGLYSSYGGLGYTAGGGYGPTSLLSPSQNLNPSPLAASPYPSSLSANYSLPQPVLSSNIPASAGSNGVGESAVPLQSKVVSDLLAALAGPTTSPGVFSVKSPLKLSESVGGSNAAHLSSGSASSTTQNPSTSLSPPQSTNTFSSTYRSPDLRWSTPTLFQPFWRDIEMMVRSLIELLKRL